ncbi:hypothetical protein MMC34_003043 [Xylographa carneopallida]|nr:hypothetical protein [Xylographa carneopallida]
MGDCNPSKALRRISLSYNNADSYASALRLVLALFPDWEHTGGEIEFVRFKDGITNTLLKAIKRRPGYSEEEIDNEAVLLRAYGKGTEVLIDRERESASHFLLAQHNLAPALLARFQNGLMYRFIRGRVCQSQDLTKEPIWKGVARRLGQWHAVLPVRPMEMTITPKTEVDNIQYLVSVGSSKVPLDRINAITPNKPTPNIWTVIQKWIFALPVRTEVEVERKSSLQQELERTVAELGNNPGLGKDGIVVGHCDLLSGNVIILPSPPDAEDAAATVSFIDYEYTTPCPAAFDIANHFAEWGGFDCDYSVLPTRSTRRAFLQEYLLSYYQHLDESSHDSMPNSKTTPPSEDVPDLNAEVDTLMAEVDRFRGIPGLYWGIWALIQATISQIDFDYAAYAPIRLQEYWDWRAAAADGVGPGERERRLAQE